jgi:hypothetical protein
LAEVQRNCKAAIGDVAEGLVDQILADVDASPNLIFDAMQTDPAAASLCLYAARLSPGDIAAWIRPSGGIAAACDLADGPADLNRVTAGRSLRSWAEEYDIPCPST